MTTLTIVDGDDTYVLEFGNEVARDKCLRLLIQSALRVTKTSTAPIVIKDRRGPNFLGAAS